MSDIYITNLGSSWSGGASVNGLTLGEPGWVFLAGGKQTSENGQILTTPLVRAYENGSLQWDVDISGLGASAELRSVAYHDGVIHVAGGIASGFDGEPLGLADFVQTKPDWPEEPALNFYPFYAQFDASTGDLKLAKVFESTQAGNESFSIVQVDSLGNSFVSGSNIAGDSAITKLSPTGEELWTEPDGLFLLSTAADGSTFGLLGFQRLIELSPDGERGIEINGWIERLFAENEDIIVGGDNPNTEFYYHASLLDESGDLYLVYTQDDLTKDWRAGQAGALTTFVMKLSGSDGQVLWSKNLDPNSYSEASSIIFDPEGNLLISGFTLGDFNGQTSLGSHDAYLATLDPDTGEILNTTLIGSSGYETASQAYLDENNNLYISGDFSSNYYSLEGSGFKNVFLISDDGFTLMGDAQDNQIHGGDGSDEIVSGDGNDTVESGSGDDTVTAGNGDDLIVGGNGAGNDRYDGGAGIDTIRYTSALAGITVDLSAASNHAKSTLANDAAGIGVDQLSSIEHVIAGYFDDQLTGDAADNVFEGLTGDDVIDGGGGSDTAVIAAALADIRLAYTGDATGLVVTSAQGRDTLYNIETIALSDARYTPGQLLDVATPSVEFAVMRGEVAGSATPTFFRGLEQLNLHYQLIDTNPGTVLSGSTLNDFIALQGGGNKAVNGLAGDDVIDGGVGSTFVTGGGGNNTFFLDGRAAGESWSTITDFSLGQDKATIWGFKQGISQVARIEDNGGASGYEGITLHFENLLPSDAGPNDSNPSLNSITFTGMSLADFGVNSVSELNSLIAAGGGGHFLVGQTVDEYGEHGYLYIA